MYSNANLLEQPVGHDFGKGFEYKVFTTVTRALVPFAKGQDGDFSVLVAALERNQRLWNCLCMDVSSDANELPDSLRAGIISLAIYVRKRTAAALKKDLNAVREIVDINLSVMRGLQNGA